MSDPTIKRLAHLNVEISERGISEFSGGKRIVFVPKEEIRKIEVRFGSRAERPFVQLIGALLLLGIGFAGLLMTIDSGMRGFRWGAGFLVFGGFGIWFLHELFSKSHYFQVVCNNDKRKLVIRGKFEAVEFSKFIKDAAELGYNFENCLSDGKK